MAGKTSPGFKITGLDKIADPNPVPENAPKLTSPLLSESDVIKAAMSGKAQIIGGSDPGFVDAATRPKSSGSSSILGGVDNFVSNVGGQITEAVKPSIDTTQLIPNLQQTPNVNQDLTKISVRGLQESAVEQAGDAQNALIDIGTAVQEQAVQSGKTGQEALVQAGKTGQEALVQAGKVTQEAAVQAGKAVQEQAVQTATQVSGGQKNETLEAVANNATKATENVISTATKGTELVTSVLTKGVETQVQQATNYVEQKVMPVVNDVAKFYTENYPAVKLAQETIHEFEKITPNIELLGSMDLAGGGSVRDTSDPMDSGADLDAKDFGGNEDPFGNIETSTTKADKLTEEERLRRIRRLMLNRYGREDTILTGAKDPFNRRRYARSL